MFNLDQAIADWRRQMLAAGIKTPVPLDELESHLRDDVEQQVFSGSSAPQAFEIAVQRIGHAAVLECEFDKIGGTKEAPERVKHALLALAGIPNHYLNAPMNTSSSNLEPRWATYLRATAFLIPAVFLWTFSAVFVVPKLQQICAVAGLPDDDGLYWNLTQISIGAALFFREHGILIVGAIILMLVLLEWRFSKWPRYRRAAVGVGAFLLNSVVLFSFFMMFVAALVAGPALAHHAR